MSYIDALKEIHGLDWTPDCAYPVQGKPIRYVSTAKLKRQIMPVLDRHGLYVQTSMTDMKRTESAVAVCMELSIIDNSADTPAPIITAHFYGEGKGDKAMMIAQTNQVRCALINTFLITDGMDDEDVPSPVTAPIRPMPEAQQTPNAPSKTVDEGRTYVQEPPKTQAPAPAVQQPTAKPPTVLQKRAQDTAIATVRASDIPGEIKDQFEQMYSGIRTGEDVMAFLQAKKEAGL